MKVTPIEVGLGQLQFLKRSNAFAGLKDETGMLVCLAENGGLEKTLRKLFQELKYWIGYAADKATSTRRQLHQYKIHFNLGLVDPDTWDLNYHQYEGLEECNSRVLQEWFHRTHDRREYYTLHVEIESLEGVICFKPVMPAPKQGVKPSARLTHVPEICVG